MHIVTASRHAATGQPTTASMTTAQRGAVVVGMTLLVAICAHIALPLPFTPVPLTLQTFAVLLVGLALGPAAGFATLALYLAEGAAGLPVFNPHGLGGIAQLLGPTGGFLLSYPFAAAAAGAVFQHLRRTRSAFTAALLASVPATLIIFTLGAGWLAMLTHAGAHTIWTAAVAPFLPGEIIKATAAAAAIGGWQRFRRG